ncbi:TPA: hypothetical protein JZF25_004454 [Escherichia coli]|nr:hypothetical protein [Escherichia coli]EHT4075852.1 hypothetical protein [Escherichia coli]EHT4079482.1 hypothetical protein [Escherichia coli]MCN5902424.1 hypothetical protein [Escherichia coli]QLY23158.1 hypothetical protein HV115_19855 [Escherichia coli]
MNNLIFCEVDELGFPKWNGIDYFRWRFLPTNWTFSTGTAHLWLYKTSWLIYHRDMLWQYAKEAQIPLLLLAGVAAAEVGGMPERFKPVGVLQLKIILEAVSKRGGNTYSNSTSVGSVAIQLGVAARTIGIHPDLLSSFEQFQLSQCLLNDRFNIKVVAFHLRDLIHYDYPEIGDTTNLTDEQLIVVGSRYNRGIERNKQDIIDSIAAPKGSHQREYSEYGRRILEKKTALMKIMNNL